MRFYLKFYVGLYVGRSAAENGKVKTLDTMISGVVPSSKTFSYHIVSPMCQALGRSFLSIISFIPHGSTARYIFNIPFPFPWLTAY